MLQQQWAGIVWPASAEAKRTVEVDTGVEKNVLKRVGEASVWVPEGFEIHTKLGRHVKNRLGSLEKGKGLDWATAEVRSTFSAVFTLAYKLCFLCRLWRLVR